MCLAPGGRGQISATEEQKRAEKRGRRKCDESGSGEAWARVSGELGGGLGSGLFLYNNTREEGQADRTVISLRGAKAKILPVSLGLEKLA